MKKVNSFISKYYWLIIAVLSFFAVKALFIKGYYGASDDLHIAWLFEMNKILKLGQIPPRYVPDLSYGFGYPLFNFVFPLPFYFGEVFHLVGFSLVASVKLIFGFSIILSGIFMYLLVSEFASPLLSLASAILYIYAPYRSTEIYVRGAIGESLAFVFLPLIIFAIVKIFKLINSNKSYKYVTIFSLSITFLILSHNIAAYMFIPYAVLLMLFLTVGIGKSRLKLIKLYLTGLFFGFVGSAYFWVPALIDKKYFKYDTIFNFYDHYPTLKQLITPYFGYGASVPGPYDGMSFYIGIINLLIVVFAGLFVILKFKSIDKLKKILIIWSIIVFLSAVFMMNFRSLWLWNLIPMLGYFQFPWRFLTVVVFSTSLLLIFSDHQRFEVLFSILVIFFSIVLNLSYFKPHDNLKREDSYYINRYIPIPSPSDEYKSLQEEYLRLPINSETRPDKLYPSFFSNDAFEYKILVQNPLYTKAELSTDRNLTVFYNKYYFPGWSASLNGNKITLSSAKPFGQIALDVPKGDNVLEIGFGEVGYKVVLDIISFLSMISLALVFYKANKYDQ